MATKAEMYRMQVAIAFAVRKQITYDTAVEKLIDHHDTIDAWGSGGIEFTDTASILANEIS